MIRHCSSWYKLRFKKIQAVERETEKPPSSTDQEDSSTNRDMDLPNLIKA